MAAALAGVLDVEVAVQLSLFMGDSVRAEYTVSQAWSSADLARSWAQTVQSSVQSTSLEQVKDAINEELAGTGFQVDSISAFEVSISVADGVPQVLSVEEDQPVIVPVIIVLGSLAIFALMCCGAAFYCRMKDRKHVETRSEAEGGIRIEEIVVAEDPEANETRQAAVAPAESLAADPDQNQMDLDNQGVPSESTARLEELMMESGPVAQWRPFVLSLGPLYTQPKRGRRFFLPAWKSTHLRWCKLPRRRSVQLLSEGKGLAFGTFKVRLSPRPLEPATSGSVHPKDGPLPVLSDTWRLQS